LDWEVECIPTVCSIPEKAHYATMQIPSTSIRVSNSGDNGMGQRNHVEKNDKVERYGNIAFL